MHSRLENVQLRGPCINGIEDPTYGLDWTQFPKLNGQLYLPIVRSAIIRTFLATTSEQNMRLRIYFMLSFLLITVGTSPIEPQDPNSWETYGIWRDAPRFPPPDIGPPVLPKGHLDDYPHLSRSQKSWIRQKTFKEHKRHVRLPFLYHSSRYIDNIWMRSWVILGFQEDQSTTLLTLCFLAKRNIGAMAQDRFPSYGSGA